MFSECCVCVCICDFDTVSLFSLSLTHVHLSGIHSLLIFSLSVKGQKEKHFKYLQKELLYTNRYFTYVRNMRL